jgi:hypothetical protein
MEIVYVHLGKSKFGYLNTAIQRSLALYPETKHTLIVDTLESFPIPPLNVNLVQNDNQILDTVITERNVDLEFRLGYWNLTLERIFSVLNYQIKNDIKQILHVESDVILMESFPFQSLENCNYVHWCEYGPEHDVASLFFVPDSKNAAMLKRKMLSILSQNPNLTDMQLLYLTRNAGANVRLFPSFTTHRCQQNQGINQSYCLCFEHDFIFDGLTYGMYLSGQDPRNNYGKYSIGDNSPFDSGATFINPRQYSWSIDVNGTPNSKCLYCGDEAKLQNLHVHSKNIELFSSNWKSALMKLVNIANKHERVDFFSFKAIFEMIKNSVRSGSFRIFLLNSPPIARAKRVILSLVKDL